MTPADKARAAGLDERTISLAYAPFEGVEGRAAGVGRREDAAAIMEAHLRVCIYAAVYDNPVGTVRFPIWGAGIVRP